MSNLVPKAKLVPPLFILFLSFIISFIFINHLFILVFILCRMVNSGSFNNCTILPTITNSIISCQHIEFIVKIFYNQTDFRRTIQLRECPNRLSSTIGGNREMDQLYTTSQVSNITRKTKFLL